MGRIIYLVEENESSCREQTGSEIVAAFFSKAKAEDLQRELKAEEAKRDERAEKCFDCGSIRACGVVKNKKTFIKRAKQLCDMANFVPEDSENEDSFLRCTNELDGYYDNNYYIRKTVLIDD